MCNTLYLSHFTLHVLRLRVNRPQPFRTNTSVVQNATAVVSCNSNYLENIRTGKGKGQRRLCPDDEEELCGFFHCLCFGTFEEGVRQTSHQRTRDNCHQITHYWSDCTRDEQHKQTTVWCH